MKITKSLIFVALFQTIVLFIGCQDSPGKVLSPKSDIYITKTSSNIIAPKQSGTGLVEIPQLEVFFEITNGVSAFIDAVAINFYKQNGQPVASGVFDQYLGLSSFIKAQELGKSGTSGSASVEQKIRFEVFPFKLYSYMLNGTETNFQDDIIPVLAKITFYGRDLNNNELVVKTQVNLTTIPQIGG